MNKKLTAIIIVGILALGVVGFFIVNSLKANGETTLGGQAGQPVDVFGTQTGTTTVATTDLNDARLNSNFSDMALNDAGYATSSKAVRLDGQTDTALFTIKAVTASTTSWFDWAIYGSNDTSCDVLATSTTDDRYVATLPITSEINWFEADPSNSRQVGRETNPTVGDPNATSTATILLTNLNWRCLQLNIDSASTTLWAQLKQKSFK